jgi:very-short-patch-repair endonuclease
MSKQIGNASSTAKAAARDLRGRETRAERMLWAMLRDRRLNGIKVRRQHPIDRYVLDFYCADVRLAIELDGEIHHNQLEMDTFRTRYLEACGIKVIRFRNGQVFTDLASVLDQITSTYSELADS